MDSVAHRRRSRTHRLVEEKRERTDAVSSSSEQKSEDERPRNQVSIESNDVRPRHVATSDPDAIVTEVEVVADPKTDVAFREPRELLGHQRHSASSDSQSAGAKRDCVASTGATVRGMRSAELADIPAIRAVLAEAFEKDPLFTWIFPDDEHRLNATAAWLGLFAESYVATGRADVVERENKVVAVALRRFPGPRCRCPCRRSADWSLPWLGHLGRRKSSRHSARSAAHAKVPYAYLHLLAVSPQFQGRDWGSWSPLPVPRPRTLRDFRRTRHDEPSESWVLCVAGFRRDLRTQARARRTCVLDLGAHRRLITAP